jgi:hypothetical protein
VPGQRWDDHSQRLGKDNQPQHLPVLETNGFGSLNLITITQTRVVKPMMGRFMSLLALTEVGLVPISNALSGLLADWNATTLFLLAGVSLTVTGLLAAGNSRLRLHES